MVEPIVNESYIKGVLHKMKRKRLTKVIGTLTTQSNKLPLLEEYAIPSQPP